MIRVSGLAGCKGDSPRRARAGAERRRRVPGWTQVVRSGLLLVVAVGLVVSPVAAQDPHVLVHMLGHNRDSRVRVQAAFALGSTGNPSLVPPLTRALQGDRSAAVRAAAATALGRIGGPCAVAALQGALRDRSSAVRLQAQASLQAIRRRAEARARPPSRAAPRPSTNPAPSGTPATAQRRSTGIAWNRVRYAVGVGTMGNKTGFAGDALAAVLREEVQHRLASLHGVMSFDARQGLLPGDVAEVQRRRIPRLRLEGNVVSADPRISHSVVAVHCEVSLMLLREPGLTMQSMLSGAATGSGPRRRDLRRQRWDLAQQALAGAVQSAMTGVPAALAHAAR